MLWGDLDGWDGGRGVRGSSQREVCVCVCVCYHSVVSDSIHINIADSFHCTAETNPTL